MLRHLIYEVILKNFFDIDLSSVEKDVAIESTETKYIKATKAACIYGVLSIPMLLFTDTTVLGTVLIPITMVSGTAWFAVSLANVKKKFEGFGMELTADMFRSFVTSLIMLALLILISVNTELVHPIKTLGSQFTFLPILSGLVGTIIVFKLIYDIYIGSMKYDINDSMLAGQTEAAEKYFKKSLSLLNTCAENLKMGKGAEVSNYYIGLAFYELFTYVISTKGYDKDFYILLKEAEKLKSAPGVNRKIAEKISLNLIEKFLSYSSNIADERTKKSYRNIQLELEALRKNKKESQEMINIRYSIIFQEMGEMLENQGESLFKKRLEIEKKFLVLRLPENLNKYPHDEIVQGYLKAEKGEELRIRKTGDRCTRTAKREFPSGYREEIEEFIPEEEFNELWNRTKGKRTEKTRYRIPYGNLTIELDIFSGHKKGLTLAEVEFPDEEGIKTFRPPVWFGEDVTKNPDYKNQNLAA